MTAKGEAGPLPVGRPGGRSPTMTTLRAPDRARRRRAPGRTRTRTAFTLLELAVAVAVTAMLFLVGTKWVLSLSQTASSATDTAVAQRNASYVDTLLRADTQDATGCDAGGLDAPLLDLQPTSVQLHVVHTDSAGIPQPSAPVDLVLWRLHDSTLQRAVITGDGSCQFDLTTVPWTTVAEGVRTAAGQNAFTGTGNRFAPADAAPYYGPCAGLDAENCLDAGLSTALVFTSPGADAATVPLSTVYPMSTSGSGL